MLWLTDDQGWSNIGYHNSNCHTPNMDTLSREGIRLDRHYSANWCAPSRASLMTGRLPQHVLERTTKQHVHAMKAWHGNAETLVDGGDLTNRSLYVVPPQMTMLPRMLRDAGYKTHFVGKWGLGQTWPWQLPNARGFDSSFGYLGQSEDYCTQNADSQMGSGWSCGGVDLWLDDEPALGSNTTCSSMMYGVRIQKLIRQHDTSRPIFLFVALQNMHSPAPPAESLRESFQRYYIDAAYTEEFFKANALASEADLLLGSAVTALKARGMWDSTLLVHASDNGGSYEYLHAPNSVVGNNHPLRGSKFTAFEGGVRVPAFVTGGLVPADRRGKTLTAVTHLADWLPTLLSVADVKADANEHGMPPVDGIDLWPYLLGQSNRTRTTLMLGVDNAFGATALINGSIKLLRSSPTQKGEPNCVQHAWTGPIFPNATTVATAAQLIEGDCPVPQDMLFDIYKDPGETWNLAADPRHQELLVAMQTLMLQLNESVAFSHDFYAQMPMSAEDDAIACEKAVEATSGFHALYCKEPAEIMQTRRVANRVVERRRL